MTDGADSPTPLAAIDWASTRRISVVGNSGSGKSTLARGLAERLRLVHVELDSIFHQRNWTPLPKAEFRARVTERVRGPAWVIDGNYSSYVQDIVWGAADLVIWLDLPRWVVMSAIVRRTLGRMVRRAELWNGNRERFRNLFRLDPEENIILWAWTQHPEQRRRQPAAIRDPQWRHLTFLRLRSRREVRRCIELAESAILQRP